MELPWTALALGLVGSLHCAGMCGPLALALPGAGTTRVSFVFGRVIYNLGRIVTYCAIGFVFGAFGWTLALAGFQRSISVGAGVTILLALLVSRRGSTGTPVWRMVALVKKVFGRLLHRRSVPGLFALGTVNGLLPCGLVYVAAAGAVAGADLLGGVLYMAAFGIGTLPVMLGIGLAGKRLQFAFRLRLQGLVPISVAIVAVLLVLRGLGLGIPFLSPALGAGSCH